MIESLQFHWLFNSLPHIKIWAWPIFKEFADNKIKVAQMMKSVLVWFENIVGKGENAGYQHFLHFPQCFQKPSFTGSLRVEIEWQWVNNQTTNFRLLQIPTYHLEV